MESNHHAPLGAQGPQPCASTSSATAARGRSILVARARRLSCRGGCAAPRPLSASARGASLRTSVRAPGKRGWRDEGVAVELDLTKRQKEIFEYIRKYAAKTDYPPTVREIGKAVGLTSSSTVHAHLANLEKIGLLRRDPTKPRAIELLVDKAKQAITGRGLPVVGEVAAGEPL